MDKILIVDDEGSVRRTLSILLKRKGYSIDAASSVPEALRMMDNTCYDLVITDLKMPGMGGIELLKRIKKSAPDIEVMILTAYGSIQSAVEAIKIGAYDYLTKPIEPKEIAIRVKNALERKKLRSEVKYLKKAVGDRFSMKNIIGQSPEFIRMLEVVEKIAGTESTVLICGESGTGKELIARAIHGASARKDKIFITINSGALPESLLEGELFGYAKGAFTGAVSARKGLFEEADQGSIFLDEISATSPIMQIRLLRVLQEQEIRRLGSNEMIKINVRVIAATNRNLFELVKEGKFREDLYYRLNVIAILIPPLRDRKDDVLPLAAYFLKQMAKGLPENLKTLSPQARDVIYGYDWPGNVRELKNSIESATALASSRIIEVDNLPAAVRRGEKRKTFEFFEKRGSLKKMEEDYITILLEENKWNISQTARNLGLARNTLLRKIKQYDIQKASIP